MWQKHSDGTRHSKQKPQDAVGLHGVAAATVIGFGLGFTGIDAIHMLVWSAVLNGIGRGPDHGDDDGDRRKCRPDGALHAPGTRLIVLGWLGTGLMAVAVIALFWSFVG